MSERAGGKGRGREREKEIKEGGEVEGGAGRGGEGRGEGARGAGGVLVCYQGKGRTVLGGKVEEEGVVLC